MQRFVAAAAVVLLAVSTAPAADPPGPFRPADVEFFEKKVRPVLVQHCVECHGPKKQRGGLRLDSRAAAVAGGDLGPAVVPGDPDKSLLVKAIGYSDDDLKMPPKNQLPAAAVADLREWVARGAAWPDDGTAVAKAGELVFTPAMTSHWSFQPVRPPAGPTPRAAGWAKTDLDRFILARLEAAKVAPAPAADARTLARRLAFDLTGLPPAPDRVTKFENAFREDADAAVRGFVDELLASPHYGERWGRHWLDVARYADTNGSEVDHAMANAWRYRDYVVAAFNADLPFDRFVREQLAGDLLPPTGDPAADAARLAATGFLMLGPKALAELDKPKLLADVIDEQVDTVGRAFFGLTLGCCRCHDHKFDPLPTADYYALAGIFQSTTTLDVSKRVAVWNERPVGAAADAARVAALMQKVGELRARRDALGAAAPPKAKLALAADAAYLLFEAEDFTKGNVRVEADSLGRGIGVVRTLMQYPDHIEYEIDIAAAGEYQIEFRYAAKEARPTQLLVNGNLEEMDAADQVTGDWTPAAQKWFVQGRYPFKAGKNVLALHRDGPVPLFDKILIGKPSDTPHSQGLKPGPAKPAPAKPGAEAKAKKDLDAAITAAQRELEAIPTTLAPAEGKLTDAPILIRGNPATPGPMVPRGFPRIVAGVSVPKPTAQQSGRLELADWVTRPEHPLTARVIVNRVWLWHFGEGLVRSPDNFGLRGETPTHPELLDHLAAGFVRDGWSLKKLHRLICTSATYRQAVRAEPAAGDPDGRLLGGWPRRRLEAEALRDAMLAASGELDRTVGGPVMTVLNRTYATGGNAPPDIAKQMHYDAPRRSLYLPVVRNALFDFFAAFDYPEPGMLTGQRSRTTVPSQALFLMNSPFVTARAKAFAARVRPLGADDPARLTAAYELALSRPPTPAERRAALAFLDRDAAALTTAGVADPGSAAWARLCHILLASNEFLYLQ